MLYRNFFKIQQFQIKYGWLGDRTQNRWIPCWRMFSEISKSFYFQLMDGEVIQPMQGPGYQTYPAIYRSFLYFLSSLSAREQFMQNPMMYLEQESPKPVVPIRMAITGPPKCGKTTCKYKYLRIVMLDR